MQKEHTKPNHRDKIEALDNLSLGISIIAAILIGVGVGIGLKNITGISWTLWIGVFIGIGAAISNVYKAYDKQKRSLDELKNDPRFVPGREIKEKNEKQKSDVASPWRILGSFLDLRERGSFF